MPTLAEDERLRQGVRLEALRDHLSHFRGIFPQDLAVLAVEHLLQEAQREENRIKFLNQNKLSGEPLPPDENREKYVVSPHLHLAKLYREKGEAIQTLIEHFPEELDNALKPS